MEWLQAILSLIGVLGLILVLFYYMKKFGKSSVTNGGKKLRIIDRIAFGRDSALAVVSVCDKLMLIGFTPHGITKLCDLELTEDEYLSAAVGEAGFSEILANIIKFPGKKNQTGENVREQDNCEGEMPLETGDTTSDKTE